MMTIVATGTTTSRDSRRRSSFVKRFLLKIGASEDPSHGTTKIEVLFNNVKNFVFSETVQNNYGP